MPKLGEIRKIELPPPDMKDEVKVAVNLFDLDRIDPQLRAMMLAGKLNLKEPVRTDPKKIDETAVVFICDNVTAACLVDVIRKHDREAGDYPTRAYVFKRSWQRVPGTKQFAVMVADRPQLNPDVFGEVETIAPPPPIRRPKFGT